MTPLDREVLAFAAVYSSITYEGAELVTCAIVTAAAVGPLANVHDRMPLVLPRISWEAWLDPGRSDPARLLTSANEIADQLEIRPVGHAVGNVRNNSSDLIAHQGN